MSDLISIQRAIHQVESLSAEWFGLALNPLYCLLNRTNCGFGRHCGNQDMQRLNHLLYTDDINPLNDQLNPTCHLLALLEAHHILHVSRIRVKGHFNPLNAQLNPICHLLALLGAHHILHVSRISVK